MKTKDETTYSQKIYNKKKSQKIVDIIYFLC